MVMGEAGRASAPRYGIIIPTRNRQRYAVEAAQTALAAASETKSDVEILLPDASDASETLPTLLNEAGVGDAVRVLAPTPDAASMQANWERAIDASNADYLIFIGDDDGLAPDALDTLDALTEAAPAPVYAWDPADYRWPCFPSDGRGRLSTTIKPPRLAIAPGKQALVRHYTWATRSKWPEIGPSVYHGAVRRDLIEKVRAKQGVYFSSFIVDYASAIANAAHIDSYVHLGAPLTILGACGGSNSAALTGGKVSEERRSETHAAHPGLTPIYADLAEARLWAPLVARGYQQSFAALGAEFTPDPRKILASCVSELGFLTDEVRFEQARAVLRVFAKRRDLDARAVEAARFVPDGVLTGVPDGTDKLFVDTMALEWRGVLDAASGLRAFAPGLGATPGERRAALSGVAERLGRSRTAA